MKRIHHAPTLCLAISALAAAFPARAVTGDYRQIYSFPNTATAASPGTWPAWELSSNGTAMIGVTPRGGSNGGGTIYSWSGAMSVLHSFGSASDPLGSAPNGPVLVTPTGMYGVTQYGGANGKGVLYKLTSTGTYQVLFSFGAGASGANPSGPLLKATDGNLYGSTMYGGACNQGVVFRYSPSTGATTSVHDFCAQDGTEPITGVIQASDGKLYGTAYVGGEYGGGTLFSLTTSGVFTKLYAFGASPQLPIYPSRLIQAKNGLLYGTSYRGGSIYSDVSQQPGTIFSSTLTGTVAVLQSMQSAANPYPFAALKEKYLNVLYGVSDGSDGGDVFQLRTATNAFTVIHRFTWGAGMWPKAGLADGPDGMLWGVTTDGEYTFSVFGTMYSVQP